MPRITKKSPVPPAHSGYAEVALNRPIDHPLTYYIPGNLADQTRIGTLVEAPLGAHSASGVVSAIVDRPAFKGPIKPITRLLTPDYSISPELMEMGRWIAEYYWCSLGEALAAISFVGLNDVHAKMKTCLALAAPDHWLAVSRERGPEGQKVTAGQARVIHALLANGNEPLSPIELREEAEVGEGVIQTMLTREWLAREQEPVSREDDYPGETLEDAPAHELTPAQKEAQAAMLASLHEARFGAYLLHGVTGSGKTEVYLRAIEESLRLGRGAIVLVPEIALTPQTVKTFRRRLGGQAGVYHSRLTLGQKYDLWRKIASGDVRVVIGTRSAIFAPVARLGVVIIDEEHEGSYKQGDAPRYHARDAAVWRASKAGAIAILGSATPSLESIHNCREGKYKCLRLPERIGPHASPVMTVVDMKRHLTDGEVTTAAALISPTLKLAIEKRLAAKEQVVLLLNRRGFANHVLCLKCEKDLRCPHCDVTLTYHKPQNRLLCHWCGYSEQMPKLCPECGEPEIRALGLGTQRIEEVLAEMFPAARMLRIDVDSMKGRRTFIEAWRKIEAREVDIILGTQMIAKGFHLESVTLAGVVSADFALFLPDFRSAERTFQLLTQVAGRAGRGDLAGEVILQTYMPHHYAIDLAARLEENAFYEKELHIRRMLRFPPAARLIGVLFAGEDLQTVREHASRFATRTKSLAMRPAFKEVTVLGPAPAPLSKLEDRYRWRVLLRAPSPGELHELLRQGMIAFEEIHQKSRVQVTIDVDPVDLL